jgi:hypothetical protein
MSRRSWILKPLTAIVVLAVVAVLFVRSLNQARSAPYTMPASELRGWTVAVRSGINAGSPTLVLQPPPATGSDLFRQVFSRAAETLASVSAEGMPLLVQGEWDRAFAGRIAPDVLVSAAREAGLESAPLEPRCLAYRHVSEPAATRQLYFVIFDSPAFVEFRRQAAALAGGVLDADALSPVLPVAASDALVSRWLPLRADPEVDCVAPVDVSG